MMALNAIHLGKKFTYEETKALMLDAAKSTLPSLVRIKMQTYVNKTLVESITSRIDPQSTNLADDLAKAVERVASRVDSSSKGSLSLDSLREFEKREVESFSKDLETDDWMRNFRGRDILSRVVDRASGGGLNYTTFRNIIIDKMRSNNFKPEGMAKVLDQILS